MRWAPALLALAAAGAASAQIEPVASPDDPRIGIVHYTSDQPIHVETSTGNDLTIMLPSAEHIQSVTVSDPNAYQVTVSGDADGLFIRSLRPAATTSMSVRTEARLYEIVLTAALFAPARYLVKIDNAPQFTRPAIWSPPIIRIPGKFKLSGNKALQPTSIHDDGAKIYIEWSPDQAIPAVFAVDNLGREEMVNGYMRAGVFTIDRVFDRLVFRIDKADATAIRILPKVKK